MTHAFVTIAIPFPRENADAVDKLLGDLVPELRSGGRIRDALRFKGVHFMTITAVRGDVPEPTQLLIEMSADGDSGNAIGIVARDLAEWIKQIFAKAGIAADADLKAQLLRHEIKTGQGLFDTPGLNFTGLPGMAVGRIQEEHLLARALRKHFDGNPIAGSPLQTLLAARKAIEGDPKFKHLLEAEPVPRFAPVGELGLGFYLGLAARGLLKFFWPLLLLLAALVALAGYWAWCSAGMSSAVIALLVSIAASAVLLLLALYFFYRQLRAAEKANTPDDSLPDAEVLDEVMKFENWSSQNHLAGISRMQPGWVRYLTLRMAFWVIGQMSQHIYKPGHLAEIGTIHFARWVLLPKTNKLLFFSNYGGSWESYLEDFITKAANGLTGAWSNTIGFPRTENLFLKGATDGERFKRWARRQQQPTRFWYAAYPHLTTARIRINAAIRQGLATASTTDEASAWLALFGSKSPPAATIETREVQTLLFGGLSRHPFATCLAIRLPEDKASARAWLAAVGPTISFGDDPPEDVVRILSLSRTGLEKLDLPTETVDAFSPAFRQGMAHATRSQILSDTSEDGPDKWAWGNPPVDAALLVYTMLEEDIAKRRKDIEALLKQHGGAIAHAITLKELSKEKDTKGRRIAASEPFGFADGISQPIIRGTKRFLRDTDKIHVVEPGEFLLGYPNNRNYVPPPIAVKATSDPANLLPVADPAHAGAANPDFGASGANAPRDFGRNGTYLVIRQLDQDTGEFEEFVKEAAEKHKCHPGMPKHLATALEREEWIGAKMVGRWKDGTSLMRYPHRPGSEFQRKNPGSKYKRPAAYPDNDFLFGSEDPQGQRCPFGAHIRRANPRESFVPGSKEQLEITNRHRILRAGRGYEAKGSGIGGSDKPGLLFMCFNSEIERQFEFIQQTWAMAWQFHELENEVDPLLVRGLDKKLAQTGAAAAAGTREERKKAERALARMTIPTAEGPIMLTGIRDFVQVRGGGYFFMPSRSAIRYLSEGGGSAIA
jgi:deferrochelatase/peroxidase EfeB